MLKALVIAGTIMYFSTLRNRPSRTMRTDNVVVEQGKMVYNPIRLKRDTFS